MPHPGPSLLESKFQPQLGRTRPGGPGTPRRAGLAGRRRREGSDRNGTDGLRQEHADVAMACCADLRRSAHRLRGLAEPRRERQRPAAPAALPVRCAGQVRTHARGGCGQRDITDHRPFRAARKPQSQACSTRTADRAVPRRRTRHHQPGRVADRRVAVEPRRHAASIRHWRPAGGRLAAGRTSPAWPVARDRPARPRLRPGRGTQLLHNATDARSRTRGVRTTAGKN